MRGAPGSSLPSAYGAHGDGHAYAYGHQAGARAAAPGHYGYQPGAAEYGGRAWPSYGHAVANETMAEMRGERTEHGLNSGHCLAPPPGGYPMPPMRPASPMRSVSPLPSRVDVATAHLRGQVQRSNSYAAAFPQAQPSVLPSCGMMSYDAALPRRGAAPQGAGAGAGSFAQPQIGVLPCRPLFPEPSARPPALVPAEAQRPNRTTAPPPGAIGMNQFKDSSSYLESLETESADELEVQSERTQALKRRQRNRSPSGRMQSCIPCLIMC